ncbi:SIS domain-containing protein [Edwardsiella anguillarum]|uniref:SIS domain-containing protein n=1 Tax=Edwardsiella anguillarum TaxID=1821960 RepID=UPI0024B70185|nr:SIS domain-containing protein [Edwardsiella anguillarum]WHP80927.1 SIS domain-containing protein [Edwardsiella anguillarum]WHQ18429.1 SIS domain-containing protein [Edwardsiella anguillarum]WHQ21968.1 SIS domain-containing protein [Edwardsiella anguillarum]WHQ25492.1 SIS domain-containing protein [Edwardsiella anguillarum]WHQ29014.1 SIS domain-containing protein [Edwardsiella anguillarum]
MSDEVLGYSPAWLQARGAWHTAREIAQQPALWQALHRELSEAQSRWRPFLQAVLAQPALQIVLCGAGSSAFVGRALAPWLREQCGRDVVAYATTDIVPSPRQYLDPRRPTLLVSFGRSGNSPESAAALALADRLLPRCHHLLLTCNPDGALARYAEGRANACSLIMPPGSCDRSFAMTSSFSCMMLAGALLLGPLTLAQSAAPLQRTAALCQRALPRWLPTIKTLANGGFQRLVVLGSRSFSGVAEEAALKMLELTAGRIATRHDSTMGLRHGPKFMVGSQTLVVAMLSAEPYCRRYDQDLLKELQRDALALRCVALSGDGTGALALACDLDDLWLMFPFLLYLQTLALETALALGITPDNPCPSGEVNRVVQGVVIYEYPVAHSTIATMEV